MKRALLLLPFVAAGGCVTTTERDCGMYDFDCSDIPSGDAWIEPGPSASSTPASRNVAREPTATPDAPGDDLESRVQRLEAEVERLRQRLDELQ